MKPQSHTINKREANRVLLEWVRQRFSMTWKQARAWVREGHVRIDHQPCTNPKTILRRGQTLTVDVPDQHELAKKIGCRRPTDSASGDSLRR